MPTPTPSELAFTVGGAEAGVEDDTPSALETAIAFGCSLQSLGGFPRKSDLARTEAAAPPSLCSEDRGGSDL